MKKKLRSLLKIASNDIPPFAVPNPFRTVKDAYNKGGFEEVSKVVNSYRTK